MYQAGKLCCDMSPECQHEIAMIDDKGFIYCANHGQQRKSYTKCRKLTLKEIKTLKIGQPLKEYKGGA